MKLVYFCCYGAQVILCFQLVEIHTSSSFAVWSVSIGSSPSAGFTISIREALATLNTPWTFTRTFTLTFALSPDSWGTTFWIRKWPVGQEDRGQVEVNKMWQDHTKSLHKVLYLLNSAVLMWYCMCLKVKGSQRTPDHMSELIINLKCAHNLDLLELQIILKKKQKTRLMKDCRNCFSVQIHVSLSK